MGVFWRQDSIKEHNNKAEAEAKEKAIMEQTKVAAKAFCAVNASIPDTQALEMPDLFPTWEEVLEAGKLIGEGCIIKDAGTLYRVVQPGGVTPAESQPPHAEGMLAVYRPIDQAHAGTESDPIPWVYGMDCTAGTYYAYNGHKYRVAEGGDMIPCVWPPDTPGLWQWVLVE